MKSAFIVINAQAKHQKTWNGAFANGLKRHGWHVDVGQTPRRAYDLVAMWSVRRIDIIKQQKKLGSEICILERGYLDNRFAWTSVSFGGGLNGRGEFRGPLHDPSRWKQYFSHLIQEWRDQLGYALICGQIPSDMAVKHVDLAKFYSEAKAACEKVGLETKFRPHPSVQHSQSTLADDLSTASFAITWNSNSAVDAVLAGIPAIAMDKGSMAWDVTAHKLIFPPMPDREKWAHALAWKQWSLKEIESGQCWDHVGGEHESRAA